ncbi:MAG: hypothetical protein ABDH21_04110 [bacterium]
MIRIFHSNQNKFAIVFQENKDLSLIERYSDLDGIIFVDRVEEDRIFFDLYNRDGTRAEVSGNGLGCLAMFIYKYAKIKNQIFVNSYFKDREYYAKVIRNFVFVGFNLRQTKVKKWFYRNYPIYELNVPNPHCICFILNKEDDMLDLCKQIYEFVNFSKNVHVFSLREKYMYTFERGVGFTASCGSGTIACAYVYRKYYRLKARKIIISSPGGSLQVNVDHPIYWLKTRPIEL